MGEQVNESPIQSWYFAATAIQGSCATLKPYHLEDLLPAAKAKTPVDDKCLSSVGQPVYMYLLHIYVLSVFYVFECVSYATADI